MSLEEWKKTYDRLGPGERRELARWVVERELGPGGVGPLPGRRVGFPPAAVLVLGVFFLGGLGLWQGMAWKERREEVRASMTAAEREREEASKPRSPKNLTFLRERVGQEVTVTGVPEASEVGFLYFSRDREKGLRLNLMPSGVVLIQSGELEALVRHKTEISVQGMLEQTGDGWLEIKVNHAGQLRRRLE